MRTVPCAVAPQHTLQHSESAFHAQAFWTKGVLGSIYSWWRQGRRSVHGAARRGPGVQHVGGQTFVYPIHAVSLPTFSITEEGQRRDRMEAPELLTWEPPAAETSDKLLAVHGSCLCCQVGTGARQCELENEPPQSGLSPRSCCS
jgi:hypothetical protein